jgi:hypothetical protein
MQKKRRNQDKGKYRNGSADIIGIEGMERGEGDAAEPGISEERFLTQTSTNISLRTEISH